jgi:ABC-type amino acid transport substrate-binding protein
VLIAAIVIGAAAVVVGELREPRRAAPQPVIVSSGSWAPFVDPDLPRGGPLAEVVTEVLRRAGYAPEISYTSWSLAERRALSGESAAVFPLVGSAVRRDRMLVSDRLADFEYVLFFDRSRPQPAVATAADLGRLRIGRVAGYDYWPELEAAGTTFVEYETSLDAFRALAAGEIDLLPEGLLSGRALLDSPLFSADAGRFDHLPGDDPWLHATEGLHLMLAPTDEGRALLHDFNAELAGFRDTRMYAEILGALAAQPHAVQVTLTGVGDDDLVELLDPDGSVGLLAPRGTIARVLDWPAEFVPGHAGEPGPEPLLVRVKVGNGPAQGRVFHVDARAVVLDGQP